MSTNYRFDESIPKDVFLAAVKSTGLSVHTPEEEVDKDKICVTDGESYLWFYVSGNEVMDCCRYGANYDVEESILEPLAEELEVSYLSEHDDGYFEDEEIPEHFDDLFGDDEEEV